MRYIALIGLSGCFWGDDERPPPELDSAPPALEVVIAATPAGDGATGGMLSVRTTDRPFLGGVLSADGGEPGAPGAIEIAPPAAAAAAGASGSIEVLQDAAFTFDLASVDPGALISVGVDGQDDVMPAGSDPHIAVDRLEVGEGATLVLSRYPLIIARELRIRAGGRLLLRDAGTALAATGGLDAPGLAGGSVTIVAEIIAVEGTIDARGNDGALSGDGGLGGHLIIRAETLTIGPGGGILVDAGHGAAGEAERRITGH